MVLLGSNYLRSSEKYQIIHPERPNCYKKVFRLIKNEQTLVHNKYYTYLCIAKF